MPFQVSDCRHCRYYTPEGRRGGYCRQFEAIVRAGWKACPLAMPAFAPSWESLERLVGYVPEPGVATELPVPTVQEPVALPNRSPALPASVA